MVRQDGSAHLASLLEVFTQGATYRDLAVRPYERIALMRLLCGVAYAALNGPGDVDDWQDCAPRLPGAAAAYLAQWGPSFELLGPGPRFLQIASLLPGGNSAGEDGGSAASKLDFALASGNTHTLFDNAGGERRLLNLARQALNLLAFQCFSPGGRIGLALWNGEITLGNGSSSHAPCLPCNMLHALVRGPDLLGSIHANLVPRDQAVLLPGLSGWGRPVWEQMPRNHADSESIANATRTFLGRLVPLSRFIRLHDDGQTLLLANGLEYPSWPEMREATATAVVRKKGDNAERFLVSASLERAPWRELSALTTKTAAANANGGPLVLNNLNDDQGFDLWVGGLVANKAKIMDSFESSYHVPPGMLTAVAQRVYEQGIAFSEKTAAILSRAVCLCRLELESGAGDLGGYLGKLAQFSKPDRERLAAHSQAAMAQFWVQAGQGVSKLLAAASQPGAPADAAQWARSEWGKLVRRAARQAYEQACPHSTPRQLRAYAHGLSVLFPHINPQTMETH